MNQYSILFFVMWTWHENGTAIIFNVYVFDALICSKPKLEHSDLSNKRAGSNKRGVGLFFFIYVCMWKNVELWFFFNCVKWKKGNVGKMSQKE